MGLYLSNYSQNMPVLNFLGFVLSLDNFKTYSSFAPIHFPFFSSSFFFYVGFCGNEIRLMLTRQITTSITDFFKCITPFEVVVNLMKVIV